MKLWYELIFVYHCKQILNFSHEEIKDITLSYRFKRIIEMQGQ